MTCVSDCGFTRPTTDGCLSTQGTVLSAYCTLSLVKPRALAPSGLQPHLAITVHFHGAATLEPQLGLDEPVRSPPLAPPAKSWLVLESRAAAAQPSCRLADSARSPLDHATSVLTEKCQAVDRRPNDINHSTARG